MNVKFFKKYEHFATAMVLGAILGPAVLLWIFLGSASAVLWVVNMSILAFFILSFWMILFALGRLFKIALAKLDDWLKHHG